jgi:hypothetical protein
LSDDTEIKDEVELAAHALDALISAHLAAGGNRFVLAAACVWGGVNEMSEITSPRSAAAALRAIASQIDPPANMPDQRMPARSDDALMSAVREQGRERGGARPRPPDNRPADNRPADNKPADDGRPGAFNQDIARDVIGEAIDLIDQAQPDHARALLMALRTRLVASPPPQPPAPRRRWGG